MYYKIETRPPGAPDSDWDELPHCNADVNCYETLREAQGIILGFEANSPAVEYRAVPITNERETIDFAFCAEDVEMIRDALRSYRGRSLQMQDLGNAPEPSTLGDTSARITRILAAIEDQLVPKECLD